MTFKPFKPFAISLCSLALALVGAAPARAAGTTPLALVQQYSGTGDGTPLANCLVYFYVAGTVSTPQQVYQDFGLSNAAPNPLQCDQSGRVPLHWLADGLVHVRLTDSTGVVQVDATLQVLGPSSGGGGGGGGTVDPTAVASTGDIKARLSGETLSGWIVLNGTTIGSASSGATQRANSDTQGLFVYLWANCPNAHCVVPGGRGASALADYNANKQITLPDMRSRLVVGRDCMNSGCVGVLLSSNITSGGGDGVDTPGASGGQANQTTATTIAKANLPSGLAFGVTTNSVGASVTGGIYGGTSGIGITFGGGSGPISIPNGATGIAVTIPALGGTASCGAACAGTPAESASFPDMNPFLLGTWYMKL